MTRPISRLAEEPQSQIDQRAHAMSISADVLLLRSLLQRCDKYLAAVAQEARIDGQPDACAEDLRRDIRIVMFGQ